MGYSIENFKEALQESLVFVDVVKSNGYNSVDGNCQSFWFEKQLSKTNDGAEEIFLLSVSNQISGYVTASLSYRKKLKGSTDILKIDQWLCCDAEKLDERIKVCEQKCLLVGGFF